MEMAARVGWQKDDEVEMGKGKTKYILMEEEKFELKPVLKFNQWFPQPRGFDGEKVALSIIQSHTYIHFIPVLSIETTFRSWIQWNSSLLGCLSNVNWETWLMYFFLNVFHFMIIGFWLIPQQQTGSV